MNTSNNTKEISVIGLGAMGVKIATLLQAAGYKVTVWNRTAAKASQLVEAGAILAPSAAAAIQASPVTIICVYDYQAATAILDTPGITAVLPGRILIQLTTGSPADATSSETWAHLHGAAYLDGAIQVAPDQMAQPDTTILVSGDMDTYNVVQPVFNILGGNIKYLGSTISAAAAMDLATLSYVYGAAMGFFHGALISETAGFNVDTYGQLIAEIAPGMGAFLQHEGAMIQANNYEITQSPLRISVEATERLLETARHTGIDTAFPAYVSGMFRKAAAAGYNDEEIAAIIKVLRNKK